MVESTITVKIIGTAQDGGIPQPNCFCNNCIEAINNPDSKRYASSLGILLPDFKKWYLIDATPDFKDQLLLVNKEQKDSMKLDGIFLTHAHIGHYTGIIFLGREAMSTKELDVFAGEKITKMLTDHAPWKQLIELNNIKINRLKVAEDVSLEHLTITPIDVPHRNEFSETFAFIISGPNKKILYIPDIDRWEDWDLSLIEMASNVDYCFIDATFYSADELMQLGRNYKEIPHPYITNSMDLLQEVVDNKSCEVYFLHFNHTNPVLNSTNSEHANLINRGFKMAKEGMEFHL